MPNQIVWCDIPVIDLDRAIRFYTAVIGSEVKKHDFPGMSIGVFPDAGSAASACLYTAEGEEPSAKGPLVYLNCSGRLDDAVAAVEPNGGKILKPKHQIGGYGFRALILDSEGNRVALHSN
jgi:uncharacterized protein